MKKKSSQRFIWVAALCGAALIGAGIFLRLRMQTTEIAPGRVSDRIVARAVVTAEGGIAEIRARTEGRVLSVHVREGDRVEAGQLLAEIESDSLEAELLRLEAERKAAALTARSVAEGARAEEKSALEAEVRGALADLEGAQDHLERLKKVREVGGGTAAEEGSRVFRRSLYIAKDMEEGEALTHENLRIVRPGYGLPPKFYGDLLGKRVKRPLTLGTPVSWDLLV